MGISYQKVTNKSTTDYLCPHTLLLVDDSPKELDIFSHSKALLANSQTTFAVLRSIREETKAEAHQWGRSGHHAYQNIGKGIFDASGKSSESKLSDDIYVYLLNNLSWLLSQRADAIANDTALAEKLREVK
ncbi:hypothetical protein KY386_01785 [Candidatus Parcubacteria bacterium]|nr:hypothetical protein [Candidatus Parcubacteria bacterium]